MGISKFGFRGGPRRGFCVSACGQHRARDSRVRRVFAVVSNSPFFCTPPKKRRPDMAAADISGPI